MPSAGAEALVWSNFRIRHGQLVRADVEHRDHATAHRLLPLGRIARLGLIQHAHPLALRSLCPAPARGAVAALQRVRRQLHGHSVGVAQVEPRTFPGPKCLWRHSAPAPGQAPDTGRSSGSQDAPPSSRPRPSAAGPSAPGPRSRSRQGRRGGMQRQRLVHHPVGAVARHHGSGPLQAGPLAQPGDEMPLRRRPAPFASRVSCQISAGTSFGSPHGQVASRRMSQIGRRHGGQAITRSRSRRGEIDGRHGRSSRLRPRTSRSPGSLAPWHARVGRGNFGPVYDLLPDLPHVPSTMASRRASSEK